MEKPVKLRLKPQTNVVVESPVSKHETVLLSYREIARGQLARSNLSESLVLPLENQLYQKAIQEAEREKCLHDTELYTNLYMSLVRHYLVNLTKNNEINNEQFISDLNTGKISVETAASFTPQEIHPERWRVLVEKKLNDLDKMTRDPEATTDMFRCGKCRRNKCKYFERQDRSSDEPMTLHITCCYCGNKWRQ
jgi:transcription elongation factor S-II